MYSEVSLYFREDLDPIYICEELDQRCPINDNGDAKFTTFDVMPKSGPQGTVLVIIKLTKNAVALPFL